jgi:nitrate/nitrite transporter NarK
MFWHEIVANNAIMLYSNKMLSDMTTDDAILTPRQGTYLVGIANFFASACSVFTAKYFTRRFLLVYGHIAIGVCHISIGYFAYAQNSTMALVSMMFFVFFYQNSSGCVTWLYCSEVAVDVVLGFVGFTGYFVVFLLTLVTNFMMESSLRPWGTFWIFGSFSLIAAVWMYIYLKDTSTLNDKEKKNLYVPEELKGTTPMLIKRN